MRSYIYNQTNEISYTHETVAKIPNIVHLIWFSDTDRDLKFIEYLCIRSILQNLRPDVIRMHGDRKPVGKYWQEVENSDLIKYI